MSDSSTHPEALSATAASLQQLMSTLSAQNAATAVPTAQVTPAANDAVSALTAARFAAHGEIFLAVSSRAAAMHELFVNTLLANSETYAATETVNVTATK